MNEPIRERKVAVAYGFGGALEYPLRGHGRFLMLGGVVLLLVRPSLRTFCGPSCLGLFLELPLLVLTSSFLFTVVRSSAAGATTLAEWPDVSRLGARIGEALAFLFLTLVATVLAGVLLYLGDCSEAALLVGQWRASCWTLMVVGVVLGAIVWLPGVGAVGAYGNGWLGWRADLHAKALWRVGADYWLTIALYAVLVLVSMGLRYALSSVPLTGRLTSAIVAVYSLLLGAHLIGRLFLRNRQALEAIYLRRPPDDPASADG